MAQMATGLYLGVVECLLLAAMAYDCCVAIGDPLRYSMLMGSLLCGLLTGTSWTEAFLLTVVPVLTMPLEFCGCHVINHFLCEFMALLKLACSDLQFYESLMLGTSALTLLGSVCLHCSLLWQDPGGCAADEVHGGPGQGVLHVQLSPCSGGPFLWHSHLHLHDVSG